MEAVVGAKNSEVFEDGEDAAVLLGNVLADVTPKTLDADVVN